MRRKLALRGVLVVAVLAATLWLAWPRPALRKGMTWEEAAAVIGIEACDFDLSGPLPECNLFAGPPYDWLGRSTLYYLHFVRDADGRMCLEDWSEKQLGADPQNMEWLQEAKQRLGW